MRIHVNLATEPFRKDRPILVASAALAVLLLILLGVQTFLIVSERDQAKEAREAVNRLEDEIARLDSEQAQLDGVLRQTENAEVLARSVFLNTLVDRKSISWTRIFADLEAIKPYNVRLVQVRLPQIDSRNEITLDMVIASQEAGPIIEFLKRLQNSPKFGDLTIHTNLSPSQNEPLYRCRVSVPYAQI